MIRTDKQRSEIRSEECSGVTLTVGKLQKYKFSTFHLGEGLPWRRYKTLQSVTLVCER